MLVMGSVQNSPFHDGGLPPASKEGALPATPSSDTTISFTPVDGPELKAVREVAPLFGFVAQYIQRVSHPACGYNSDCYIVDHKLALKRNKGWRMKKEGVPEGLYELTTFLCAQGCRVPRWVKSQLGEIVVRSSGAEGEVLWSASHWIGSDVNERYLRGDHRDQYALGLELAQLHRGMLAFAQQHPDSVLFTTALPHKPENAYNRVVLQCDELDRLVALTTRGTDVNDLSARFREVVGENAPHIRRAIEIVGRTLNPDSLTENAQLTHGYLSPQNILVEQYHLNMNVIHILDFETVQVANPLSDLGGVVLECIRQGAFHCGRDKSSELFEQFIMGYERRSQQEIDQKAVKAFALNRAVLNALLNIRRHFADRNASGDFNFARHLQAVKETLDLLGY